MSTSQIRVLMAADVAPSRDTGLGRHQWFLARELERQGFEVREYYAENAPRVRNGGLRRFYFPWAVYRELIKAQRNGQPYDVALIHEGSASFSCIARRVGLLKTMCVVVSHNPEQKVWELRLQFAGKGWELIRWQSRILWPFTRLWQSNLALRRADHVLCLSSEDKQFVHTRFHVPEDRLHQISNGVEDSFFESVPFAGAPRILFLGSWLPHKGISELAVALRVTLQRFPSAHASFIGVGLPEHEVAGSLSPGIQGRVAIRSHVSPEELPGIFSQHNIFVLPSWYEGMPLSLLEAMAACLAVVVTDVGGMRDVVQDGIDGIRIPPHDQESLANALCRLCESSQLRTTLGAAARIRARSFTWQRAGQTLADCLRTICATAQPAAHVETQIQERHGLSSSK